MQDIKLAVHRNFSRRFSVSLCVLVLPGMFKGGL